MLGWPKSCSNRVNLSLTSAPKNVTQQSSCLTLNPSVFAKTKGNLSALWPYVVSVIMPCVTGRGKRMELKELPPSPQVCQF